MQIPFPKPSATILERPASWVKLLWMPNEDWRLDSYVPHSCTPHWQTTRMRIVTEFMYFLSDGFFTGNRARMDSFKSGPG